MDRLLPELFAELPALAVTGPRATGKTTTAARLARTVVRLDRPGRFLLTGSVRADPEGATWPDTGRIVRVPMFGMAVRERRGGAGEPCFLARLAGDEPPPRPAEVPDLRDHVGLPLLGGFPEPALHTGQRARRARLERYIDQVVTRDAPAVDPGRVPIRLRRDFEGLALDAAGTVTEAAIFEAAGVNRKTPDAYERLFTAMFLTEALPSWTSNRLQRLSARPKRDVVDPALAATLLRVDELGGGKVVALEVRATASPARDDARHLRWPRDRLEDRFASGIVLHAGPRAFDLDDRIRAVPVCALWG